MDLSKCSDLKLDLNDIFFFCEWIAIKCDWIRYPHQIQNWFKWIFWWMESRKADRISFSAQKYCVDFQIESTWNIQHLKINETLRGDNIMFFFSCMAACIDKQHRENERKKNYLNLFFSKRICMPCILQ